MVGAPKAGTTALHAALSRHPEVFMPRRGSVFVATIVMTPP
jgi:hypothetical protein